MKYFELAPFELRVDAGTIVEALAESAAEGSPQMGSEPTTGEQERP
jgi:hypothetical protein